MVEVNVIEVCVTNVVILSGHMWLVAMINYMN